MSFNPSSFKISDPQNWGRHARALGFVGILASIAGYFLDAKQFFYSYLTSFAFWLTLALGGLFLTLLHHLVGAKWSVVLRRIFETSMSLIPIMALFFIPLILGLTDLYQWSDATLVAKDELLQAKAPFLNVGFFLTRAIIYLAVWITLAYLLYRASLKQDAGGTLNFKTISAPGMLLFAFTLAFASFDWIMSLDTHWFSTIFGVYVFAGVVVGSVAFTTLVALHLKGRQIMDKVIGINHYHDLGKLLFAFTVFWAYIGFSQFFLIWYANVPEETIWFLHRWEGSWKFVSMLLVLGHFAAPFLILMNQEPKRNPAVLKVMGFWYLFIHYIDLHWLIMPNLHHHGFKPSWMDVTTMMAIGGIFVWQYWQRFSAQPLVPLKDPNLQTSIEFANS